MVDANCNLPHHYPLGSLEPVDLVTSYVAEDMLTLGALGWDPNFDIERCKYAIVPSCDFE